MRILLAGFVGCAGQYMPKHAQKDALNDTLSVATLNLKNMMRSLDLFSFIFI